MLNLGLSVVRCFGVNVYRLSARPGAKDLLNSVNSKSQVWARVAPFVGAAFLPRQSGLKAPPTIVCRLRHPVEPFHVNRVPTRSEALR